jgi:hypothetical protein
LSKLADFMAAEKKEPRKGMEVDIDVACQTCFEYVDLAEYFNIEKLLRWKCSQGHISFIEDFRL